MTANILLHLKHKIESLLFSAARRLSLSEIKRLTHADEESVLRCLKEYQKELEEKGGSIHLISEGDNWQLSVKEQYIPVIKKVVTQIEMPKTIIETLAMVAYKAPVLQSQIIKLRTNKGYKHLEYLENEGFITREKKGRTKLLRLTSKFYDYFNLDPKQVKEALNVKPYGNKEEEKKKKEKQQEKQKEEERKKQEIAQKQKKGIELTPEQEKKVEEKVKEMVTGTPEKSAEEKEEK